MKIDLRPGRFYKDRSGRVWCCVYRGDQCARCVMAVDDAEEAMGFYVDGRYAKNGDSGLCLISECTVDGRDIPETAPDAVRIEIEFSDGQIRRLTGVDAARWLDTANKLSLGSGRALAVWWTPVVRELKVAYLAHALSAPTEEGMRANRARASKWAAWLWAQGYAVECSWIVCTGELAETPENRKLGLASDCEQVRRSDLMVLAGTKISSGMLVEAAHAKKIFDFTHLKHELPPPDLKISHGREITFEEAETLAGSK